MNYYKRLVSSFAYKLFKDKIRASNRVGLGTGSTIKFFIEMFIRDKLHVGREVFVSSLDTYHYLLERGVETVTADRVGDVEIDIYVDGFDEANTKLDLVKGRGGAFYWEKKLASRSKTRIYIGDYTKYNERPYLYLKPVPIEVKPSLVGEALDEMEKLGFKPRIRYGRARDGPVTTDSGNYIVDLVVSRIMDPLRIDRVLKSVKGVVETGVFPNKLVDYVLISGPLPSVVRVYRRGF